MLLRARYEWPAQEEDSFCIWATVTFVDNAWGKKAASSHVYVSLARVPFQSTLLKCKMLQLYKLLSTKWKHNVKNKNTLEPLFEQGYKLEQTMKRKRAHNIEFDWLSFSLMIRPIFQGVRTVLHSLTFTGLHAVTLAFRINLRTVMEVVPMAAILKLCTVYSLIGLGCSVLKASVCLDII